MAQAFKTSTKASAHAIVDYWQRTYQITATVERACGLFEVKTNEYHLLWREICEAFCAGYHSRNKNSGQRCPK